MIVVSSATRSALRELLKLAWPVILARIGIMTMGLTDAIVVGNYSSVELAYHSLAWAPTAVIVTTAVGLLLGVQVMTARMLGQGRKAEVGGVLRRGMVYALQIGVASMIALIVTGPWALRHMNLEAGLGEGGRPALVVFALSMPAYLVAVGGPVSSSRPCTSPKPGMIAMLGAHCGQPWPETVGGARSAGHWLGGGRSPRRGHLRKRMSCGVSLIGNPPSPKTGALGGFQPAPNRPEGRPEINSEWAGGRRLFFYEGERFSL